jgi:hypothetical protein
MASSALLRGRAPQISAAERELRDWVASCYHDPLRFVRGAYPWGEPGPLEAYDGPDTWQREFLEAIGAKVRANAFNGVDPVDPVKAAVSSGHGIGKSAMVGWLVDWIMSTRPHCQGTVTANTITQLNTKTWPAIQTWTKRCLTAHWFVITTERLYHPAYPESWFCARQSSKEHNSEAFAGQHAATSSSFYINDEDSAVPDKIHEVEEGGLTDGEPFQFLFGNPTRNTGAFHKACFGSLRDRYLVKIIDSRTSRFTNKNQIQQWAEDYGEDSDFFRVRVRGLPPNADELQFIDHGRIAAAQANVAQVFADEPLIAGVDVSGGGSAMTVCRFRRGFDARSIAPIRLTGEQTQAHDRQQLVAILAERLRDQTPDRKIAAMFIDSAFGAVIVSRLKQLGFDNVYEVNFGGPSRDAHQANLRAYMWNQLKEWLPKGAIPKDDERLATDLGGPGFHLNKKEQLVLESKASMLARGVASPDDGDALALTWAMPVAVTLGHVPAPYVPRSAWG